jgi:hypothetical protein
MTSQLTPIEFLKTIYLGDRGCKAIRLEAWEDKVVLEINEISRIRSQSGRWEFYTDEDIVDGRLVFTGVESINFDPSGPVPNDFINGVSATAGSGESSGRWIFEASISSVGSDARSTEVIVRIVAADVHIEDPARAGVKIRE